MTHSTRFHSSHLIAFLLLLPLCACQSMYYGAMEKFGVHKRDILVDRVEEARDEQEQAKQQFRDALEAFSAVVGFEGGDLEALYENLHDELEHSESQAEEVRERIDSVDDVAEALFEEWERELDDYSDDDLRRASRRSLDDTRERYNELIRAMRRAESKMDPVLTAFRDQVLFLKHNLNARAIASLENNVIALEEEIAELIREMEDSIDEANRFIEAMGVRE